MNPALTPDIKELTDAIHYRPAISLIMPFDPRISSKDSLAHALKLAADKIKKELHENYPQEISDLMMFKLNGIIKGLNYATHKKSIAIYLSPVFEKVMYLDISVDEKLIVDESFEIRDLVYNKKQLYEYLVVVLGGKESRFYRADINSLVQIISDSPQSIYAYTNDVAEKVANFSDSSERKEITMEKFLRHIDDSLDIILHTRHLPVFVLGTERMAGHFNSMTRHKTSVIEYVYGDFEKATTDELRKALEPELADWEKVKQKDLLNQLEDAAGKQKLVMGITEVWKKAMNHNGRLLLVEKNYYSKAEHGSGADSISDAATSFNKFSTIKDAVDDVIEKVLENGGDVEFFGEGELKNYDRIALLLYY